jgi:hypothetical protein
VTALAVPTPQQVLDTPMQENDADAATIREYLYLLLRDVWIQEQGFNGKRPFGNSCWQSEVYEALGKANYIALTLDDDGYVDEVDDDAGDALIHSAIASLLGVDVNLSKGGHAYDWSPR